MKFILSLAVGLALATDCLATGSVPPNQPQAGTVSFSAATGLAQTIAFPFAYQSQPAVLLFPQATNNTPATVSAVTLSNFVATVTTGTTTNLTLTWSSFEAYPRIYAGTNILAAGGLATNTFAVPFVYPPVVTVTDTITNGYAAVTSTTTTNCVITVGPAETVEWGALGSCYQAGQSIVTQ